MTNVLQKEFNLEETNKKYADGGDPTVVIIREATTEENKSREDFLNAKISENIDFIRNRNKDSKNRDWYDFRMQDEKYIDDTHSRLSLVEYRLRDEIALYEIAVTLAACNLVGHDGKTPYILFRNGYIHGSLPSLIDDMQAEIHEKVLEMNPAWQGALDRIMSALRKSTLPESLWQGLGNFKDLALKSVYVKSKGYLLSLMDEIKSDVFDNDGLGKVNVPAEILGGNNYEHKFALKKTNPPLENIILFPTPLNASHREEDALYFSRSRLTKPNQFPAESKIYRKSYIGVIEHGKYEIRVVAKNRGFNYWDTFIEEIIPTLRSAIEWWKRKPVQDSRKDDEDTSWMDEAQDFYSDIEADGYVDDD